MRLRQSLVLCGLALSVLGCAAQTSLPPSATVADIAKAMKGLSPRDAAYQALLDRLADPARTPQTVESEYNRADALFNRARAFEKLTPPDWAAANNDYTRLVTEYEQNPDALIDLMVSASLLNAATNTTKIDPRRLPEALDGYNRALARVQGTQGAKAQEIAVLVYHNMNFDLLQGTPEQRKQGLIGLETLTQRYRTSPLPEVRVWVVSALVSLADETQNTPSTAIAFADDALTLVPTLAADVQERWKADATLKKTGGLFNLGKNDEAVSLSRSLVETNYTSVNILQRRFAARAALNILVYQRDTFPGKLADIEALNQDIQTKFRDESDQSIRAFMLQSLLVFGMAHESTPKFIEAFQEIERRLAQDPTTIINDNKAAVYRGLAMMNLLTKNENKAVSNINKLDELLYITKNNPQKTLSIERVRSDIYAKQVSLFQIMGINYYNKISPIIDNMDQEFFHSDDPNIIENILWANANYLGAFLDKSPGAWESALVFVNPMIQRYGNRLDPKLSGQLALTYVNRIVLYSNLQPPRNKEILEDSDLVVSRYQDSQNRAVRALVAKALTLRSAALKGSDRPGAIQTLEKLIALYGADSDPRVVEWVTKGRESLRRLTLPAVPTLPVTPKL